MAHAGCVQCVTIESPLQVQSVAPTVPDTDTLASSRKIRRRAQARDCKDTVTCDKADYDRLTGLLGQLQETIDAVHEITEL